jgi:DNA-binding LytR/AlgR family response regulator
MNNTKIRYMIIDDEPIAHRIIEQYCAGITHLQLVNNSYNALEALQYLANETADLMFLDINMPKLTGFEFLKTLNNPPKVIVTSAYQEFAIEGYELNVCDYLLKPFSFERFLKAVNKATTQSEQPTMSSEKAIEETKFPQRIYIKGDKKHHQVCLSDIHLIEACGNYCLVYLYDQKIITHQKISAFEKDLPIEAFMRVHKSFIVALDKISSITATNINIGATQVPIGQTYKNQVLKLVES